MKTTYKNDKGESLTIEKRNDGGKPLAMVFYSVSICTENNVFLSEPCIYGIDEVYATIGDEWKNIVLDEKSI